MEDILLVHRKSNKNFPHSSSAGQDVALWKTCLRQILFCREEEFNSLSADLESDDNILRGEKALGLLLEILCGLHSPVLGETEVFGQFKNFVNSRKQANDPLFADNQKWLSFINSEVKKIRTEHIVGLGSQSYGSLLRRYTKDYESVTLCGSGQLALEILPWLAHKKTAQVFCRKPERLQTFAEKYNNLIVKTYDEKALASETLIIAAPLSDELILKIVQKHQQSLRAIFDLRGEENNLENLLKQNSSEISVTGLEKFFSAIEETKKETQVRLDALKNLIIQRAAAFTQRTEIRPLGWDDLCA